MKNDMNTRTAHKCPTSHILINKSQAIWFSGLHFHYPIHPELSALGKGHPEALDILAERAFHFHPVSQSMRRVLRQ